MNYDPSKPYCGFDNVNDLKADLVAAFQEAIVIPNEWLPAEYQNHKEFLSHDNMGSKTLSRSIALILILFQR